MKEGEFMLNDQMLYLVYWDSQAQNAYLYGSQLRCRKDGICVFQNERMPSGFCIQSWSSKTSFAWDRREPSLPLLQEEENYLAKACMRVEPEGTVMLRLSFYDRQKQCIATRFLEGEQAPFQVPGGTSEYKLELVQSGSKKLEFYGILLCADTPLMREVLKDWTVDSFQEKAGRLGRRRMLWVGQPGGGRRVDP